MGKGDRKTTRGKRVRGSYGNTRMRKKAENLKAEIQTAAEKESKPKPKATKKKKTEE